MKKYFLMFGLTLVMGLFIANVSIAQGLWQQNPTYNMNPVGLGITTPAAPLHVHMTAPGLSQLQRMVNTGVAAAGITFDKANTGETAAGATDFMGSFVGRLYDGSNYVPRVGIRFQAGGSNTTGQIVFQTHDGLAGGLGAKTRMILDKNGDLFLDGKFTSKEIEVKLDVWPDFVFSSDYYLRPLSEVEKFINTHSHLPGVPSEAEVLQNGVNVGEMTSTLLLKIEELTLYIIELNKRIEELEVK